MRLTIAYCRGRPPRAGLPASRNASSCSSCKTCAYRGTVASPGRIVMTPPGWIVTGDFLELVGGRPAINLRRFVPRARFVQHLYGLLLIVSCRFLSRLRCRAVAGRVVVLGDLDYPVGPAAPVGGPGCVGAVWVRVDRGCCGCVCLL